MAKDRESRTLSKAAGKRSGGGNHLSAEERALWEYAARDLKPLKGKKPRVHGASESEALSRGPPGQEKKKTDPHRASARSQAPPKPAAPPPLSPLDRRKARHIGTGRIEVEARIDLHGLRQSEAHTTLRRFLIEAHAKGRRWVLVITGKGAPPRSGLQREDAGYGGEEERGVLRRNVPRWLAEPELRAIVVGFTAAAVRHGGEGALYVQLRRRERTPT